MTSQKITEVLIVRIVFSDFWHEGAAGRQTMFCKHQTFGAAEQIACRIMVLLGAKANIIFLQHNAGNAISGGPVPAKAVTDLVPFGLIAKTTGETIEEVKKRLIVFTTSPKEAGDDMPIIRLQDIRGEELQMSELEVWGLGPEHPLAQILDLAIQASSRK